MLNLAEVTKVLTDLGLEADELDGATIFTAMEKLVGMTVRHAVSVVDDGHVVITKKREMAAPIDVIRLAGVQCERRGKSTDMQEWRFEARNPQDILRVLGQVRQQPNGHTGNPVRSSAVSIISAHVG